jgi:hypothetical protein
MTKVFFMKKSNLNLILKTVLGFIITGIVLIFTSCGETETNTQNQSTGHEPETKTSAFIIPQTGWSIEIPADWENASIEDMAKTTTGAEAKLIRYKSNSNIISAFLQDLGTNDLTVYNENYEYSLEITKIDFTNRGYLVNASDITQETVAGQVFNVCTFTFNNADGTLYAYQKTYSAFINGFDLQIFLFYNNDTDKDELLKILKTSKFVK